MIQNNLRNLIRQKNLSQTEVARRCKLKRGCVASICAGRVNGIRLDTLNKLCNGLNCRVEEILVYVADA